MAKGLVIARIRGVPLKLHWTFLLVVGLIAAAVIFVSGSLVMGLYAVGLILLLFFFVLVHELAHVAVARRYGIPTKEITLLPIGGISHMERIPEAPDQEAKISIAGPLVNVGFALLLAPFVYHFHGGWSAFVSLHLLDLTRPSLFLDLFWLNVIMGAFNLLPAFPLDGGRVLRALLALKMSYVKATKVAADTGKTFAILFGLIGIFVNFWLVIIAVFVYLGAAGEERAATAQAVFRKAQVKDVMHRDFVMVRPDEPIEAIVERSFQTRQMDFPVARSGRLLGFLDRGQLTSAAGQGGLRVEDVMRRDIPQVTPEDDLSVAFRRLQGGSVKALIVVSDDREEVEAIGASAEMLTDNGREGRDIPKDDEGRRLVGILAVEDMERAYLYISQRESMGADTRVGSPMQMFGGRKRRVPKAGAARVARGHSRDEREVWVPVMEEPER